MCTGWDNGLCQDYNRALGRWFADRLGAREQLRRTFMSNEKVDPLTYPTSVVCANCSRTWGDHNGNRCPTEGVFQPTSINLEEVLSAPYFAVLSSAYRNSTMPVGADGSYRRLTRDDPEANEFRADINFGSWRRSIPLGKDRAMAEMLVHSLNEAYSEGLRLNAEMCEGRKVFPLVGRMGHSNRNEAGMP